MSHSGSEKVVKGNNKMNHLIKDCPNKAKSKQEYYGDNIACTYKVHIDKYISVLN